MVVVTGEFFYAGFWFDQLFDALSDLFLVPAFAFLLPFDGSTGYYYFGASRLSAFSGGGSGPWSRQT